MKERTYVILNVIICKISGPEFWLPDFDVTGNREES